MRFFEDDSISKVSDYFQTENNSSSNISISIQAPLIPVCA